MSIWNNNGLSVRPNYSKPVHNRSIDTNEAIAWAAKFDLNGDNQLNKRERILAAKAAEQVDQTLAELFHTFDRGGIDGTGLLPDENGDGNLGFDEIVDLANHDGDYHQLSVADFKKGFPGQAKNGGNDIYHNQSSNNKASQNDSQSMVKKLLTMLLSLLMGSQDSYSGNAYGNNSNPYSGLF